jgi:hypothetical protein
MRIFILALALMPATAPATAMARDSDKPAAPKAGAPAKCQNAETQHVAKSDPTMGPQTLARQPMANQYLGVLRLEEGCDKPVMIREGVGAGRKR